MSTEPTPHSINVTGGATGFLPTRGNRGKPITVIGTEAIRSGFDAKCIEQALNSRGAPGVTDLVLNPDAHAGYGAPVGCVMVSPTHIYPGPVGVDIKCSMSLLALDLVADAVADKATRRALINAICERTPTGAGRGQRMASKSRHVSPELGMRVAIEGASVGVCEALGIPPEWADRCEDAAHVGHDTTSGSLDERLKFLLRSGAFPKFDDKITQLGSYGGGNHFGECEAVTVADNARARQAADVFGLQDGNLAFLSLCGSRGFGYKLADGQFRALQKFFETWGIPLPGGDKELVYAPLGTIEADNYIDDMSLGGNFATVNTCSSTHSSSKPFRKSSPVRPAISSISSATTSPGARSWTIARLGFTAKGPRVPFQPDTSPSAALPSPRPDTRSFCLAIRPPAPA